jgi:hypothetical protein
MGRPIDSAHEWGISGAATFLFLGVVEKAEPRSTSIQNGESAGTQKGEDSMRFMMIVIPKGYESAAPDTFPDPEMVAKMMEYNKSLQTAGVLLALDGLFPPSTASRISFLDGKSTVTDGPFTEAKETIGGYWIIQVRSREEAIEWARRAPMSNNEKIEVRRIMEMGDYPGDVQQAAEGYEDIKNAAAAKL